MKVGGLTEHHALRVVAMSASSLRYQSSPDRNMALRSSILSLEHRHRRYRACMIYLKLRQRGLVVNHKRVERLYKDAELQVRKRKRKKLSMGARQPLTRPGAANEVWSMDFVFDRSADTRVIKSLTIVDDVLHMSRWQLCLNEHWFVNLAYAQTLIEAWQREYTEARPKKVLGV